MPELYARTQGLEEMRSLTQQTQVLLALRYKDLVHQGGPYPTFNEVGFRIFSQTNEDGILLYIFSLIGTTNRKAVEICAGSGIECNTANLIINHNWRGLLFDGNDRLVHQGQAFYARHKDTLILPPTFVHAWITPENVDDLIAEHGFDDEIDLLSLDIDGQDYWVWQAMERCKPRVIVLEAQSFGAEAALSVPYDPAFVAHHMDDHYLGATIAAFVKLGRVKGYRFVGFNSLQYNAFFIRDGIAENMLPEVPLSSCLDPALEEMRRRAWEKAAKYAWVEV